MNTMNQRRLSTGIKELDKVMNGGLIPRTTNLVRGGPGVGKTTLGLQFLINGLENKEKVLLITGGETEESIRNNAERMGLNISGVKFLDLSPGSDFFSKAESYDIFSPAEVEREPTTQKLIEIVESEKPTRVFLDSITQFRSLATDDFQYRKQALSLLRYLKENNITTLFTTEHWEMSPDDDMQFQSDCIINLEQSEIHNILRIRKFRGSGFISGDHTYKIEKGGISLFPNIVPSLDFTGFATHVLSFGIKETDELLKGGVESGTISLISGHSGTGKTTLAIQLAAQTAQNGGNAIFFSFEEEVEMILRRCDSIQIPARELIDEGNLNIFKLEPLLYSADEFAHLVLKYLEKKEIRLVVIDSTTGYKLSLPDKEINTKLHALCKYLQQHGITVILINEVKNITGNFRISDDVLSYIADNVLILRYLEIDGNLKKAIGVIKKRLGDFEKALREFEITKHGIRVGKPLNRLRGILSGTPEWVEN